MSTGEQRDAEQKQRMADPAVCGGDKLCGHVGEATGVDRWMQQWLRTFQKVPKTGTETLPALRGLAR